MVRTPFAYTTLVISLALAISGCRCGGGMVDTRFGDLKVVWRTEAGEVVRSRDATYDFGTALVGETKRLIMTVRNDGIGQMSLNLLERTEGDQVTIAPASSTGAPFFVDFRPDVSLNAGEEVEFAMTFTPTALQGGFLYVLHFQQPGVAEAELDADIERSMGAFLYSLSGDIPRADYRFFDTAATDIWGVLTDAPGPLPWLSAHDLEVFTAEFARKGTFRGGINWYRNIDANAALLAPFVGRRVEQPALFIGAEHDSIFGQTRESVEATRSAVPQLQQVWIDGSGHWVQQERPDEVNAALVGFLGSLDRW